ncbi:hypothetical protein [Paenibacillus sp. 7541]|uniref:hypothetical protein n=1 Tax=Paenibacillus sp. 7541 TaxID=2026236 RepID=UPI0020D14076|nr:hypothetical protein [Paenibacillus sp. 7541]
MIKKLTLMAVGFLLVSGLLTACKGPGTSDDHAEGHVGSDQENTAVISPTHDDEHEEGSADHKSGSHGDNSHAGHDSHSDMHSAAGDNYTVDFSFNGPVRAAENAELTLEVTDSEGNPVQDFDISHEKLMHLIVVNEDLSFFEHIHPDYEENGRFTVTTEFPYGGRYKLFADFVPKGQGGMTVSDWMEADGEVAELQPLMADESLIAEVDGKEVELTLSNTLSNEEVILTFDIRDAATKQGIQDLEPYLGAIGHVVILSEDAEHYLHVHPLDGQDTGPKAEFVTSFPESGVYKIWGQFQHNGEVFTVSFAVEVQ